ncbi:MAG: cation-translocating P-type ATPase [Bacteroidota bacterium]
MEDRIILSVEGMTCNSCAQGISSHLKKRGIKDVVVDYEEGQVLYGEEKELPVEKVIAEINSLGYKAFLKTDTITKRTGFTQQELFFFAALVFTVPLLLHMLLPFPFLHNSYLQFFLSLPVVLIGIFHFGRSAWGSLKHGQPNMDVLILTGSLSAFIYSVAGLIKYGNTDAGHQFLFFETAAAIITFLLLGNLIENRTLKKTNSAVASLAALQPVIARRIINALTDKETTEEINAEHLKKNDLILVNTGDKIPADGLIYQGNASIDESAMTGESMPAEKSENDKVLAGTIVINGSIKMIAEATGSATVLNNVIAIVKNASHQKPNIQRLGDKVSSWFVPTVLIIAVFTFFISWWYNDIGFSSAMMRSIAVLVISCPCAMGLATPTAVAAGVGRAAKEGILVKGGRVLEDFAKSTIIVFDKTGTLTDSELTIAQKEYFTDTDTDEVHHIIRQLEKHSSHPVGKALMKLEVSDEYKSSPFTSIEEEKGFGMRGTDKEKNKYYIGRPSAIIKEKTGKDYQVVITKNETLLAAFTLDETIREGAAEMVAYFRKKGMHTVLLSGDRKPQCEKIAAATGIDEIIAEKLPLEKSAVIESLKKKGVVSMVGDGINDSPSLTIADVGISFGSATQVAIGSSDIILLGSKTLFPLIKIHQLALATLTTIKQNLFWALVYNIVAIPIAAIGLLSPLVSSFSMAFSDVIVIGNSLRLKIKNIFTGQTTLH